MADGMSVNLEGLPEVIAKMKGLNYDLRRKGGRFALRKASNLVRDAAKANASRLDDPMTSESIEKNIAVRFSRRTFQRSGDLMFRVGVLGGANQYANTRANARAGRAGSTFLTDGSSINPGGDTYYWRYLEFGTQHIAAKPFMRPALAQNIQAASDEFVRQYGRAIDRALRRAAKGGR